MRRSGCQPFRSYSSKNGICLNCEGRSARQQQLIVKDARRPPRRVTLTVPTCKPLVAYDHLYLAQTPADPPELLRFGFHEKVSRKRTGSNFTIVALRASPAPQVSYPRTYCLRAEIRSLPSCAAILKPYGHSINRGNTGRGDSAPPTRKGTARWATALRSAVGGRQAHRGPTGTGTDGSRSTGTARQGKTGRRLSCPRGWTSSASLFCPHVEAAFRVPPPPRGYSLRFELAQIRQERSWICIWWKASSRSRCANSCSCRVKGWDLIWCQRVRVDL